MGIFCSISVNISVYLHCFKKQSLFKTKCHKNTKHSWKQGIMTKVQMIFNIKQFFVLFCFFSREIRIPSALGSVPKKLILG